MGIDPALVVVVGGLSVLGTLAVLHLMGRLGKRPADSAPPAAVPMARDPQERYTLDILDSVPVAITLRDASGKYLYVNRQWEEWFDSRDSTVGSTVQERLPERTAREVLALDRSALERGPGASPQMDEIEFEGRHYTQTRSVLADADGNPRLLVATIDTTERHEYQRALADRNKFITEVIEALPVSVVIRDTHGRHVQVNRAWEKFYNVRREDVLGKRFIEFKGWRDDPELTDFARQAEELDYETLARGADKPLEPMERRRKGRIYLNTRRALVDTEGKPVGIVGVSMDVTDQRALEDQVARQKSILETTLENMDQGITMIDRDLRIMAFNWKFLELLEMPAGLFAHRPSLEDALRYNAQRGEYGPGDPDEQVRSRLELARKFEAHYFERTRPNGTVIAVRGQPLPGGAGFVTTYTDITEQKRAEAELKASVALREEVERMSRHDLKTPINSVIAVSRMLRENSRLPADDAQLLATVERAGYRILDMVNLSLDLFRMEQGTYEFRPQVVDLGEVAAKVATDLQSQAASKQVFVKVNGTGLASAWAEELLCYSILANLVKNAIEAAPENTEVTIDLAREGESALVSVHNVGVVPEAVRGRFFQKYATAGKTTGIGYGTYSASLLARVQGGELDLDTSEAAGTTLTVRLRAAEASDLANRRERPIAPKPIDLSVVPDLPQLRVLVADDDEFNRLVLRHHLPAPPLNVVMAVNGRAAVEAATAEWPDVVLLDLEMPVMDGYDAARRLREIERERHRKRVLIVAISSNDEEAIVRRALAAGCDQYLVKPASREILWQILAGATVPLASGGAGPVAARVDDDVALDPDLQATLPGFLASRREALDEMPRALASGDRAGFKRLAHRLAGSFALYGFRWASAQARSIERDADAGDGAELAGRVAAIRAHLESVKIKPARQDKVAS